MLPGLNFQSQEEMSKGEFLCNRAIKTRKSYQVESVIEPIYTGGHVQVFKPAKEESAEYLVMLKGTELHFRDPETGKSVLCVTPPNTQSQNRTGIRENISADEETGSHWQAFLANKDSLYTANRDGLVEAWSINDLASLTASANLRKSWKTNSTQNSPVTLMKHHAASPILALGFADGSVSLWDSAQGYCTHTFKSKKTSPVALMEFWNPDPTVMHLYVGWEDGFVGVFDLFTSKQTMYFQAHVSAITGFALIASKHLITVGRDKVMHVFELSNPKPLKTLVVNETVESMVPISGQEVAIVGELAQVTIWNWKDGHKVRSTEKAATGIFTQVSTTSAGILCVSNELQLVLIDTVKMRPTRRLMGHFGEVTDFTLVDGSSLAVATNGIDLCVFDSLDTLSCRLFPGHTEAILAVAHLASSDFVVTGSRDANIRVWDLKTATSVVGEGHTNAVPAICVAQSSQSRNQFHIASVSSDLTAKLWLFDVSSRSLKTIWTVKAHEKEINAVAFSPDNRLVLTAAQDKMVKAWDVLTGKLVHTFTGHKRGVWALATGINAQGEACLVTGSADRTVRLWSLNTGFSCLRTFEGHANSVLKVSLISSGSQILSAGSDGLLKLWSVKDNECITTLDEHIDRIWALIVENDGDRFISGDASACIKVWRDVTEEEQAASRAAQQELVLKEQELEVYLLRKDLSKAVILAMNLNQPFRLCGLFEEMLKLKSVSEGLDLIGPIITSFTMEQKVKLFEYVREWNLSYRRAYSTQIVLAALIRDQRAFYSMLEENPSLREVVKGLLPYSQKHFERTDELLINSHLVDLALLNMRS